MKLYFTVQVLLYCESLIFQEDRNISQLSCVMDKLSTGRWICFLYLQPSVCEFRILKVKLLTDHFNSLPTG